MPTPNKNNAPRTLHRPIVTARGGERGITYRSEKAHVQYWTGLDIPVEFNAERLISAYRAWMAATTNGVPRLSDIMNSDASAAVNDHLLFMQVNDDYLVVSQGSDHIHHIGRDLRGRMLSELNTPIASVMKDLHDQCLADKQAIYARFVSELATDNIYWEGLKVPLCADDSGRANMVMTYSIPIDNKTEIFQMVLDRAPVGVIAAVPFGSNHGDARIVSINARAKQLLKFDANGSRVHYIRDLVPWFRDIAWTRTGVKILANRTCFSYRDPSNHGYSVTMEPLKRFLLFTIVQTKDNAETTD